MRREFIQTVIGAYQDGGEKRTIFVSTHLISEFEGLIDEFTVIENGREVMTLEADAARERYQKIYARFSTDVSRIVLKDLRITRSEGRELEVIVNGNSDRVMEELKAHSPETLKMEALSLEEIFVASLKGKGVVA